MGKVATTPFPEPPERAELGLRGTVVEGIQDDALLVALDDRLHPIGHLYELLVHSLTPIPGVRLPSGA